MTGYEQFLVVVLATFLAIFLLLGIILLIFAIKLVMTMRRIMDKAEKLTEQASHIGEFVKNATGPMTVARAVSHLTDVLFRKKSKNTKRKG